MSLKDIEKKVWISREPICYGHYRITIKYRGELYTATTSRSDLHDDAMRKDGEPVPMGHLTRRNALIRLYEIARSANGLY